VKSLVFEGTEAYEKLSISLSVLEVFRGENTAHYE
jgi:hypothetical protein